MKLLNTITLPNQYVAQGINHVAVYQDTIVSKYLKNKPTSKLTLTGPTTQITGVRQIRISPSGEYTAVQTKTKTVRLRDGVQETFDNNIGAFSIADTGQIVMIALASGAVQVIDSSVTNLTVAVTDDDRVVCAAGRYMVYNRARTITAAYADLVLTPVASAKEIVYVTHDHNGKFVVFYLDGTYSYNGAAAKTLAFPLQGFRDVGDQIIGADMKNDYVINHFRPQSFPELMRPFSWKPPVAVNADFNDLILMAPGSGIATADFDLKNNIPVNSNSFVTSVSDSPYGATGKSLLFNGTTSILQTADSVATQLGALDFTIECFVKVSSLPGALGIIYQKGALGNGFSSYQLSAYQAGSGFSFRASTNGTAYDIAALNWGKWTADVWTHIAITRKGNTWRCFQDGKLQVKYTSSGTVFPATGKGLQFGALRAINYDTGTPTFLLNGNINGFQILNYAKYVHDFYPETLPVTLLPPYAKAPIAATVPNSGPGWGGYDTKMNTSNKLFISLTPAQYIDPTFAVKSLPAVTFPQTGVVIQSLTDSVLVSTRPYSGDYKVSSDGGQTWQTFTPPNGTSGVGNAVMFKGALYVQHNITGTVTTVRKFAALPALTYTDTNYNVNDLLREFSFDANENSMLCSPLVGGNTALYISWDGSTFTPYETGIPGAGSPSLIYYVGNNVYFVKRVLAPTNAALLYVPPTAGAPTVLGSVASDVQRILQFKNRLALIRLGLVYTKPIAKRADDQNATLADAQAYYAAMQSVLADDPLIISNSSAYAPWYSQDKLIVRPSGTGTTGAMVAYEMA